MSKYMPLVKTSFRTDSETGIFRSNMAERDLKQSIVKKSAGQAVEGRIEAFCVDLSDADLFCLVLNNPEAYTEKS